MKLADRVGRLHPEAAEVAAPSVSVPEDVLIAVREALLSGETHYVARPGLIELRQEIAERISRHGGRAYDPATQIVVTAGEEEALFVTGLALAHGESAPADASLVQRAATAPELRSLGVVIGNLDALPGVSSFRVGFVAGPADLVRRVQTWKQAFSICTAGPSQRAALSAVETFGERSEPGRGAFSPDAVGVGPHGNREMEWAPRSRQPRECGRVVERERGASAARRARSPAGTEEMTTPGEKATLLRYSLVELAETLPDVISLGRGDPDLATPPSILSAALEELRKPAPPPPLRGIPSLRAALADRYRRDKGLEFDPNREILITNGAQEGLFLSMLALVNPGDRVLVQDPRYSSYDQAIAASGGEILEIPTGKNYDFALDPADLAAQASSAKLLVLVNPNNPTGALIQAERVREIARMARETGLTVISDEIYENLVFDGKRLLSVVECEGMRERTVTLSGFSKTYAMTGFRMGYLMGPADFIDAAARIKQAVSGPCPLFSQLAARAALNEPPELTRDLARLFERRRTAMMRGLDRLGIRYGHPGGAFYIWADISGCGLPAEEFCRRLLLEARVLMFPGSSFGERWGGFVRISLLQPEERLEEAVARLEKFWGSSGASPRPAEDH